MKSFLEECAADILSKFGNSSSVCVVFPNNRTLLHFRKEYARIKNQVSFSGFMFPISKVLNQFLKSNIPDELTLLFYLYEAFRKVFGFDGMYNANIAADFNSFYDTGCKILQDFNEIDNYLVDIDQLCHNFADINELEAFYSEFEPEQVEIIRTFWANFSQERLSREKERYRELWTNLPRVYHIFQDILTRNGAMYSGMKNRRIYQLTRNGQLPMRFKTYIFVGFNVLNKCERGLFGYLRNAGRARFYWDADDYYISDKAQEAGLFMRGLLSEFPDELNRRPQQNILHNPKKVEYIGVPLEVAQAKCIHGIIEALSKTDGYSETKTAVVLGDEHLLFPVLNSLPQSVRNVNVTMGYPFSETPVYSFILNCLQLRRNFRKAEKSGTSTYYFNDVLSVINHPLVANLPDFYSRQISARIREDRMIRVAADFLGSFSNILNTVFCNFDNEKEPVDILQTYLSILSELYFLKNPKPEETPRLENEFLFNAYLSVKTLYNNILKLPQAQLDEELVISILKSHLLGIIVPFESQDDQGIQVMGMMETRNLDFDNVIMLGMNEGVFPKRSENNSFITEGMRLAFDMPIVKYKDAVFGYFFYRLFQRAENVTILYNNVFSSTLSGEPSRFVTQLLKEASMLERKDSRLDITLRQFVRNIKPVPGAGLDISSNVDTVQRLGRYYSQGEDKRAISPSALNTFINCPLKFYFQYVLLMSPLEELDEEGSPADFGLILHAAIENIYNHIADGDRMITAGAISAIKPDCERFVMDAYNDVFKLSKRSKDELSGFEAVFFDVLMQYLHRILDYDITIAPFELMGAEKGIYSTIDVPVDGKILHVNIGGTIDRIDKMQDGTVRIVDYKTGNVTGKMNFKSVEDVFDEQKGEHRPSQAFQVLLYSYVYMQKYCGENPEPVIYAVRSDISARDSRFKVGDEKPQRLLTSGNIRAYADEFAGRLKDLLATILNPETRFEARPSSYCQYCNFAGVCQNG